MSAERSAFETFWIAKGASPGSLRDIERFARDEKQRLRDDMGFPRGGFLPADAPIGAKTVFNQKRDLQRLAEIATSEDSAIQTGSWPDLVGLRENLTENIESLRRAGGAFPAGEERFVGTRSLTDDDVEEIAADRAREFIIEKCEEIDEAGADGADTLEAIVRGDRDDLPDVAAGLGDDLDEIAEEFGLDLVTDAIAECRDRLPGPLETATGDVEAVLEELNERFDMEAPSLEVAVEQIEQQVRQFEERASRLSQERASDIDRAATNRLSRRFGVQFEDLEDAARRLKERVERARGERLRIAPIEIRRAGDDVLIRVEDGEDFEPFRSPARTRIERELDLSALGTTWTTVGEVRLRGEDLEAIDLETGRERLGSVAAPQPLDVERRGAGEQAELEAVTAVDNIRRLVERGREEGL